MAVSSKTETRKHLSISSRTNIRNSVYNIKRRMASLPPIDHSTYTTQLSKPAITKSPAASEGDDFEDRRKPYRSPGRARSKAKPGYEDHRTSDNSDTSDTEDPISDQDPISPTLCLFCTHDSPTLETNLNHMSTTHSFTLPNPDRIVDIDTFLSYLGTEIYLWHECLYCGAIKDTVKSIQSHMRDKNHCILNFEREPELWGFWEGGEGGSEEEGEGEGDMGVRISNTEIRLKDGKVISSRHTPSSKKTSRKRIAVDESTTSPLKSLTAGDEKSDNEHPSPPPLPQSRPSNRQLALRSEMGIAGLAPQQRQALVLAEKKAQRSEAMARRAREWVYARGGNKQEFDQVDTTGKWGKQNHKLLPR